MSHVVWIYTNINIRALFRSKLLVDFDVYFPMLKLYELVEGATECKG